MFIGEAPGAEEDKALRAFVGKSGKVLWHMTEMYAGLERSQIHVDNLGQFRPTDNRGKDRPPTEAEFAEWAPQLRERIAKVDPRVIVTLGRWSTRAVLRRDLPMAVCHGRRYKTKKGRDCIPVLHPAAGLRDPTFLALTAYDLQQVGSFIREDVVIDAPTDRIKPSYSDVPLRMVPNIGPVCGLDTEYDPETKEPWCFTFSATPGIGHMVRATDERSIRWFKLALEQQRPTIVLHNSLADLGPLRKMGIDLIAMGLRIRDTQIELFLTQLNPQRLKHSAARLLGVEMKEYAEVVGPVQERFARDYLISAMDNPPGEWGVGEGRKWSVMKRLEGMVYPRKTASGEPKTLIQKWSDDSFAEIRKEVERVAGPMPRPGLEDMPDEFVDYACRDADTTLRQGPILSTMIEEAKMSEVHAIDHGALPLVDRMQQTGLLVDTKALSELRDYVIQEQIAITEVIRMLVGRDDFNPGSADQVAAFCAEKKLGLSKLTPTGKRATVDENALQLIRFAHPVIEPILYYRELDKLRGTYIEPLFGFLVGKGRYRILPGNFRLTSAITGRMSMNDPNLMAFPKRSLIAKLLRKCIVARKGRLLASCDLSQIELRVGAGLSQDEAMIQAFIDGADLHTRTASALFNKPESEIDDMLERYPCKTANFAIFYGAREHRLNAEFLKAGIPGYDLDRCAEFVRQWFSLYPGVERWIHGQWEFGREHGYVVTEAGRRRYLPALQFTRSEYPFSRIREEAQRQASNYPVQGTAQEIEKKGMAIVWSEVLPVLWDAGYHAEPLLQVHDDLVLDIDEDAEEMTRDLMLDAMTRESPWHGVPLRASWKTGRTWADL